MKQTKVIEIGELLIWAVVSVLALDRFLKGAISELATALWIVAWFVYSALLIFDLRSQAPDVHGSRVNRAIFLALILDGFLIVYLSMGYAWAASVIALVLPARRLPSITSERNSWLAVGAIVGALMVLQGSRFGWNEALNSFVWVCPPMVIQVAFSVRIMRERIAREELAIVIHELRATRELLAQRTRADERLRISRDLHDTLGHHLTGLSIQLDVAARRSEGPVAEHIQEAHAITRLLLGDVRNVVGQLRTTRREEFAEQIRNLTGNTDELIVHLDMCDAFGVDDSAQADTLLRCVQEIVTNTRRHAAADNLWIKIAATTGGLEVHAHDDGRGADPIKWGHGLTGMRERFAQHGGRVDVTAKPQGGVTVHAFLPQSEAIA